MATIPPGFVLKKTFDALVAPPPRPVVSHPMYGDFTLIKKKPVPSLGDETRRAAFLNDPGLAQRPNFTVDFLREFELFEEIPVWYPCEGCHVYASTVSDFLLSHMLPFANIINMNRSMEFDMSNLEANVNVPAPAGLDRALAEVFYGVGAVNPDPVRVVVVVPVKIVWPGSHSHQITVLANIEAAYVAVDDEDGNVVRRVASMTLVDSYGNTEPMSDAALRYLSRVMDRVMPINVGNLPEFVITSCPIQSHEEEMVKNNPTAVRGSPGGFCQTWGFVVSLFAILLPRIDMDVVMADLITETYIQRVPVPPPPPPPPDPEAERPMKRLKRSLSWTMKAISTYLNPPPQEMMDIESRRNRDLRNVSSRVSYSLAKYAASLDAAYGASTICCVDREGKSMSLGGMPVTPILGGTRILSS